MKKMFLIAEAVQAPCIKAVELACVFAINYQSECGSHSSLTRLLSSPFPVWLCQCTRRRDAASLAPSVPWSGRTRSRPRRWVEFLWVCAGAFPGSCKGSRGSSSLVSSRLRDRDRVFYFFIFLEGLVLWNGLWCFEEEAKRNERKFLWLLIRIELSRQTSKLVCWDLVTQRWWCSSSFRPDSLKVLF